MNPAKVLAHLERERTRAITLPATVLKALPDDPNALLTDLGNLERVRYYGEKLGIEWPPIELVHATEAPPVPHTAEQDWTKAVEAVRTFSHAALRAMREALPHIETVLPRHEHVLERWHRALERPEGATWDEAEEAWQAATGGTGTIDYARRCADHLPQLFSGEVDPTTLMFPEGRMDLADALYRENVMGRYQHATVAAVVHALDRPLRIIEIGAGTGATTEHVLPNLHPLTDYLITDVSRYFVDQAQKRFPGNRYGTFDIDADGQDPGEFDVVIAGGVLNAAKDTDASLRRLKDLLADGGWLVISEPTVEEPWVLMSQAFLMAKPADARKTSTFLTHDQWRAALENQFELVLDLPHEGHPLHALGHRVFVARKDSR
ncbi:methyltransferase family protein [Lentzea atacamensis]|uniref:Methyltransferase family protein n=1 Tax=Lentzea atacamensis TaxID=531938 RepID=A0ABX9EIU2_9PSEU|nr:class I SAM-dependent methyltransferase [Lentzea atacamensis]RAS71107.1 methyltransferase family protein [Lentzea atacamensis]